MTKKERIFADEYLIDLNGTRAYLVAYPTAKKNSAMARASKLLRKPDIQAYVDEELEKMHNERTANAQEVIEYLSSVMRGTSSSSVLAMIGDNQEIIEKPPDEKEKLKAAELLGKRYGIFTEKVEVNNEEEEKKQQSISNIEALVKQMVVVEEDDISD